MKPDRTNYEVLLIDYLDGNLDGEQERQLLDFLDENPDIKNEFEGLSAVKIPPQGLSFMNKNSLRRSTDDLSESQFDYLCAASVENDLSPEQKAELDEIVSVSDERRRTFGLYARTKLIPPQFTFSHKNRLRKLTTGQKVFRISVSALSAAATILMLFTLLRNPQVSNETAETGNLQYAARSNDMLTEEKTGINDTTLNTTGKTTEESEPVATGIIERINRSIIAEMKQPEENIQPADSSRSETVNINYRIEKISGYTVLPQGNLPAALTLVSMNLTYEEYSDEVSENVVGNFFTRMIRDKILKSETPEKGSLKAYEVADAGITGINLLFGSNMTLEKTLDENGEVKSVYFNSKLLKFNAPVKKAEPQE